MSRTKPSLLPVPVEAALKILIEEAAVKTHLSQADVMRSALRIGVPELVKRLRIQKRPRRELVEYLDAFAGLIRPRKEVAPPPRFK